MCEDSTLARTKERAEVERRGRSLAYVAMCDEREAARDGRRSVRPQALVSRTRPRAERFVQRVVSMAQRCVGGRRSEDEDHSEGAQKIARCASCTTRPSQMRARSLFTRARASASAKEARAARDHATPDESPPSAGISLGVRVFSGAV